MIGQVLFPLAGRPPLTDEPCRLPRQLLRLCHELAVGHAHAHGGKRDAEWPLRAHPAGRASAGCEAGPELGRRPIASVGEHGPEAHTGRPDPVELRERELASSRKITAAGTFARVRRAASLAHPSGTESRSASPTGTSPWASAAGVLPRDADRVRALLEERGVVDDKHRVRAAH